APGGAWRGHHPSAHPPVLRPAVCREPAAVLRRGLRGRVPGRVGGPRPGLHRRRRPALPPRRPAHGAAPVPVLDALPGAAVRGHGRRREALGPADITQTPATTTI